MFSVEQIPVFIIVRDRVHDLRILVAWLEECGQTDIRLLDNDSSYPPLLEYLSEQEDRVIHLPDNPGYLGIWTKHLAPQGWFILSDPDLIPLAPLDGIKYLYQVAMDYPDIPKVGFGLTLDGVPPTLSCLEWEQELWDPKREIAPGLFKSPIDTTLALYRPDNHQYQDWEALRTGPPYLLRHSSFYTDPEHLSEEDLYYLQHCAGTNSSWAHGLRQRGEFPA